MTPLRAPNSRSNIKAYDKNLQNCIYRFQIAPSMKFGQSMKCGQSMKFIMLGQRFSVLKFWYAKSMTWGAGIMELSW